jgi:hypothetical protein
MSAPWDLQLLREHIKHNGNDVQRRIAIVHSLGRYVDIFRYHLYSARDAMKGVIYENDPHGIRNMQFVFGDGERQEDFDRAKVASEAHTLATIHSTRAMWDVFAFLVNAVALNSRLGERECSIFTVRNALSASNLRTALDDLTANEWFLYVNAFVNTAKHRSLVPQSFRVSFEDDPAGLHIESFEYDGHRYRSFGVREVLSGAVVVKNRVVECGKALNAHVSGAPA